MSLQVFFAIVLGVLAVGAVVLALRPASRERRISALVFALAAGAQAANLLTGYSVVVSILTTLGLLVAVWMMSRASAA